MHRRAKAMITGEVTVENESFLNLSFEAQALYFELNLLCDPIGVITGHRRILGYLGATAEAFDELLSIGLIYRLEVDTDLFLIRDFWLSNRVDKMNQKSSEYVSDIDGEFVFYSRNLKRYVPKEEANENSISVRETLFRC